MFEFSLPTVLVYIYFSYCLMLIARKLKVNLDMVAWISILQFFVLTDVAKKPWWYVVLLFVPIVNLFIWYDLWSSIALQMHRVRVGAVWHWFRRSLFLFPAIWRISIRACAHIGDDL